MFTQIAVPNDNYYHLTKYNKIINSNDKNFASHTE